MSQTDAGSGVTVQPGSSVKAEHNGDVTPMVTMWFRGIPAQVREADVPTLQASGWLLFTPDDLVGLGVEVELLGAQLAERTKGFVAKVLADRVIDSTENHELHAMRQCGNELVGKINAIIAVAAANFDEVNGPEDPANKATRLRVDMEYHGWTAEELQKRYGLTDQETQAAAKAKLPEPEEGE